jgi:3-methyl-2-oxobutanoate hydroxymethyltransferase
MAMRKTTILDLGRMKADGQKIVMITAYDAMFARIFDDAGVDVILVGDSLGMVVLGHADTLNVTMEDMVRHTEAAARGRKRAFLAADMPFLSYQAGPPDAIRNAGRLLQAGAEAVKLAGAFSVVLEGIPAALAGEITRTLSIPTIGIGAGAGCDGQVLVMHDLLGLFDEFRPKFVKRFGELRRPVQDAVGAYSAAVRDGSFPGKEHSF